VRALQRRAGALQALRAHSQAAGILQLVAAPHPAARAAGRAGVGEREQREGGGTPLCGNHALCVRSCRELVPTHRSISSMATLSMPSSHRGSARANASSAASSSPSALTQSSAGGGWVGGSGDPGVGGWVRRGEPSIGCKQVACWCVGGGGGQPCYAHQSGRCICRLYCRGLPGHPPASMLRRPLLCSARPRVSALRSSSLICRRVPSCAGRGEEGTASCWETPGAWACSHAWLPWGWHPREGGGGSRWGARGMLHGRGLQGRGGPPSRVLAPGAPGFPVRRRSHRSGPGSLGWPCSPPPAVAAASASAAAAAALTNPSGRAAGGLRGHRGRWMGAPALPPDPPAGAPCRITLRSFSSWATRRCCSFMVLASAEAAARVTSTRVVGVRPTSLSARPSSCGAGAGGGVMASHSGVGRRCCSAMPGWTVCWCSSCHARGVSGEPCSAGMGAACMRGCPATALHCPHRQVPATNDQLDLLQPCTHTQVWRLGVRARSRQCMHMHMQM